MTWTEGQKVIIRNHRGTEEPGVVTKVGRKYVTVERDDDSRWKNPRQYHKYSGREKSDYSSSSRILTPEMALTEKRRADALAQLKELGWEPVRYNSSRTPVEAMEAMVQTLKEHQ